MHTLAVIATTIGSVVALVALVLDISIRVISYVRIQQREDQIILTKVLKNQDQLVELTTKIDSLINKYDDLEGIIKALGYMKRKGD